MQKKKKKSHILAGKSDRLHANATQHVDHRLITDHKTTEKVIDTKNIITASLPYPLYRLVSIQTQK